VSNNEGKQSRGILTEADRAYLRNPDDYSRQASYNREQAIRQRLQRAFSDFPLLVSELDDTVLDDLLGTEWTTEERDDGTTVHEGEISGEAVTLPYAVAFLIRAELATSRVDPVPEAGVESSLSEFVRSTERGIEIWLGERYELTADVSVSITADDVQRSEALADDLVDQDEPLSGRERLETVAQLSRAGYTTEQIVELVGEPPDASEE